MSSEDEDEHDDDDEEEYEKEAYNDRKKRRDPKKRRKHSSKPLSDTFNAIGKLPSEEEEEEVDSSSDDSSSSSSSSKSSGGKNVIHRTIKFFCVVFAIETMIVFVLTQIFIQVGDLLTMSLKSWEQFQLQACMLTW